MHLRRVLLLLQVVGLVGFVRCLDEGEVEESEGQRPLSLALQEVELGLGDVEVRTPLQCICSCSSPACFLCGSSLDIRLFNLISYSF